MSDFKEEDDLGKAFDARLLKRLLKYAKPYIGLISLCFVLLFLITITDLARPYLIKIAIDDYMANSDKQGLQNISLLFLATIIGGFIFNYIQIYLLNYTGQKIIYSMRQELFSHIQRMSLAFFDKNPVGRLVTRVTNDMENLNEMYTSVLVNLFKDILLLVGIVGIMLQMNAKLALISFIAMPLIVVSVSIFRKQSRKAFRLVRVKLAKINATLSENISGMKIIQIFNQENFKNDEFYHINKEYREASMRELLVFAVFRPSMDLIYSFALALLIWYGGGQVLNDTLPFGVLFAFINYIDQFFKPINDLSEKFNILQSAMASSERIFLLLDEEENIKNPELPLPLDRIKGEIEFKDTWFAYEKENWVLRDINFKINPGETVAFVGATGAGKTSIISLITRLYDIQKGNIFIDGKSIKEVDKYELRSQIGVVLQDVFLFTGDIKGNIRLNNNDITNEKIEDVANFVNADRFIKKLPDKYNEEVKERGSTLSSGQRQLLAFARALAFDPAILVLDEATSNIDTETEILIQDAIKKVIKGRTTIVIAHRLSTIQHADKIIVMHKGKIREMGTHQELLEQKGMYHDLYLLQYKE